MVILSYDFKVDLTIVAKTITSHDCKLQVKTFSKTAFFATVFDNQFKSLHGTKQAMGKREYSHIGSMLP